MLSWRQHNSMRGVSMQSDMTPLFFMVDAVCAGCLAYFIFKHDRRRIRQFVVLLVGLVCTTAGSSMGERFDSLAMVLDVLGLGIVLGSIYFLWPSRNSQ